MMSQQSRGSENVEAADAGIGRVARIRQMFQQAASVGAAAGTSTPPSPNIKSTTGSSQQQPNHLSRGFAQNRLLQQQQQQQQQQPRHSSSESTTAHAEFLKVRLRRTPNVAATGREKPKVEVRLDSNRSVEAASDASAASLSSEDESGSAASVEAELELRASRLRQLTLELPRWPADGLGVGLAGVGLTASAAASAAGAGDAERIGVYVKSLTPGGWAERDGRLKLGDQILEINGQRLVAVTPSMATEILQQSSSGRRGSGGRVTILVGRQPEASPGWENPSHASGEEQDVVQRLVKAAAASPGSGPALTEISQSSNQGRKLFSQYQQSSGATQARRSQQEKQHQHQHQPQQPRLSIDTRRQLMEARAEAQSLRDRLATERGRTSRWQLAVQLEDRRLGEALNRLAAAKDEFEQTERLLAETRAETKQLRRRAAELDALAIRMLQQLGGRGQEGDEGVLRPSSGAPSRGSNTRVTAITRSLQHLSGQA